MKVKKHSKSAGPVTKTRKQLRKEKRKEKKVRRNEFYTNRNKNKSETSKAVPNMKESKQNSTPKVDTNKNIKPIKPKTPQPVISSEEQLRKTLQKEKKEHDRLQKEMAKQRKEQLQKANDDEDKNIKRLEKQLNLNKRKSKNTPKSFTEDGLDYLLEVCDPENMKQAVAAEQHLSEINGDFEEDFALMTGKSLKKNKPQKEELDDSDIDMEGDFGSSDEDEDDDIADSEDVDSDEETIKPASKKRRRTQSSSSIDSANEEIDFSEDDADESDDEIEPPSKNNKRRKEKNSIISKKKKFKARSGCDSSDEEINLSEDWMNASDDDFVKPDSKNNKTLKKEKNKGKTAATPADTDSTDDEIHFSDEDIVEPKKTSKAKKDQTNCSPPISEDNEVIGASNDDASENSKDDDDEEKSNKEDVWEDIYGRLRGKDGSIIKEKQEKYIPPAIRAKMEAGLSTDKKREEKLKHLKRQLKGLLNKLAESNMHGIASQVEELYMNNSRNDMNETLTLLLFDAIITPMLTTEQPLLEHVMLVTILHANVGTEVGAHFLQSVVRKFDELYKMELPVENKMLDNVICIIAQLYNYKVFHVRLMYEIINKLSVRFTEPDIECILLVLKSVGFSMRKDDPLALKELILSLQKQANSANEEIKNNPRIKFMLDILLAIKNNNMNKIPNYDTSISEHLKKLLKGFIRKGSYVTTLNISLDDLLKADECGKWWVVGSAWTGKTTESDPNERNSKQVEGFSQKLLEMARKQRMNTDTRRNVFCVIMSAEDYLDAFEKLLHLGLKNQQEREIVHVLLHCCLQEKKFNPYYAVLAQKFCEYDRKFQMTIKYSAWDKLKALTECSATQLSNLAKLLTHLFLEKGLPISTLKIVQFGELDKIMVRFMRQVLIGILLCENLEVCQGVFANIAQSEKLKMFRESLKLFIQHFLLRNLKAEAIPEDQKALLEERAKMVDKILSIGDKKVRF